MPSTLKYYELVGEISSVHSNPDFELISYITQFIYGETVLGFCLLSGSDCRALLTVLSNIIKNRIEDSHFLSEYEVIASKLKRLNERRNDFIHSTYLSDNASIVKLRTKRKSGSGVQGLIDLRLDFKVSELRTHLKAIRKVRKELATLFNKYNGLIRQSWIQQFNLLWDDLRISFAKDPS